MSNSTFTWCFIGTGTLARQVAAEITASGRHRITAVCSRRFEAAEEFAKAYGAKAYESTEEAMTQADAVYVVTPHPTHYQYTKMAIEAGKPVLCEKPFTVKACETKELFRLAREKQVYIVEGMWTWFAPVARKVKEWVDGGAIGAVQQVTTKMLVNVIHYAPRLTDPALAGGAILDSGVYPITYLYRLFGKPTEVRCSGRIVQGVDLGDEIDLAFGNGLHCHISLAIDSDADENFIRIEGEKADIYLNHFHYTDHADLLGKDGNLIQRYEGKTTILEEFDKTAEEFRAGKTESAFIPPQATIDVMDIMDACREQIGLVYPFEQQG